MMDGRIGKSKAPGEPGALGVAIVTTRLMKLTMASMASMAAMLLLAAGCSSDSRLPDDDSTLGDPTTRAMSDPMGYAPSEHEDISGGGLTDFNNDAFKKDMNHVLNP